jgi:hypothetical protein
MYRSVLFGFALWIDYLFGLSDAAAAALLHSPHNVTNVYKTIVHVSSNGI